MTPALLVALALQDAVRIRTETAEGQRYEVVHEVQDLTETETRAGDAAPESRRVRRTTASRYTDRITAVEDGAVAGVERTYADFRETVEDLAAGTTGVRESSLPGHTVSLRRQGGRTVVEHATAVAPADIQGVQLPDNPLAHAYPAEPVAPGTEWEIPEEVLRAQFRTPGVTVTTLRGTGRLDRIETRGDDRCAVVYAHITTEGTTTEGTEYACEAVFTQWVSIDRAFLVREEGTVTIHARLTAHGEDGSDVRHSSTVTSTARIEHRRLD